MLCRLLVLSTLVLVWGHLRGSEPDVSRRLVRNTDNQRGCFGARNRRNYFARNPWNSDSLEKSEYGERGDWAKCLPSPSFAIMCTHAQRQGWWHKYNAEPREDQPSEALDSERWAGQLHDMHAGWLYEALLRLHEEHCAHVELELSEQAKRAFDDYILGQGLYHWAAPEPEPEGEPEGEPEPEAEPMAEPEAEPEAEAEAESEAEPEGRAEALSELRKQQEFDIFSDCSSEPDDRSPRHRLRKSLYCAMKTAAADRQFSEAGQVACDKLFGGPGSSESIGEMRYCPEDGGTACGVHVDLSTNWPHQSKLTCDAFCSGYDLACQRAELARTDSCEAFRPWHCAVPAQDLHRHESVKCVCENTTAPFEELVRRRPVRPPSPVQVQTETGLEQSCPSFARLVLRLDVTEQGDVVVSKREQFDEQDQDLNDISYEVCEGKELTVPESPSHCSMGSRMDDSPERPCLVRLEQRDHIDASAACAERGGHLAHVGSMDELQQLVDFAGNQRLGIGLFDAGGYRWRFEGEQPSEAAAGFVYELAAKFGKEVKRTGCIWVHRLKDGSAKAEAVSCAAKIDWVCEGASQNTLANVSVTGDLLADEGAFCLWHYREPLDELPNDEGNNFRNTDLACSLQVSSRNEWQCGYNPETDKLFKQRGDRDNLENYPVKGDRVGWTGRAAEEMFLVPEDAYDYFHCHYTPMNSGLMRMFEFQHMFDRNYPGALRRTCGCGYKHLAKLVSRCDCTRSGKQDNNCATWHQGLLTRRTTEAPVRCNNCNAKQNI